MSNITKLILIAQPSETLPFLNRGYLKKGIYQDQNDYKMMFSFNFSDHIPLNFTDIGKKVYDSALEFDENTKIWFLGSPQIGIAISWDILIENKLLEIKLESRQYYIPIVGRDLRAVACKIIISGADESIKKYLGYLKKKFKYPPTKFSNWKKLEKKLKVKQSDIEEAWRTVSNN